MAEGHRNPFSYTPKQVEGFLKLAQSRERDRSLSDFNKIRLAYHGKKKDVEKFVKEMQSGNI